MQHGFFFSLSDGDTFDLIDDGQPLVEVARRLDDGQPLVEVSRADGGGRTVGAGQVTEILERVAGQSDDADGQEPGLQSVDFVFGESVYF